ncbi:MAG TPA: GNAT family N-acetyltransferase [Candidatus Dormibacteraeota bacterium]|nr:GNAT family N-acetyltransferase [Candidatus Dormibacteraeota bacterium]
MQGETRITSPGREALETARLRLEPVGPAHAEGIHEAVVSSRRELLPWMPWARDPKLDRGIEMSRSDRVFHFALVEKESGLVLGIAGLNREGDDAAELHYWIRTDHAGRGLTTEACRALIEFARRELTLERLTLWAGRDNVASRRVAEKLGFVHVGPLSWRPEGGFGDFPAESYELRLRSGPPG